MSINKYLSWVHIKRPRLQGFSSVELQLQQSGMEEIIGMIQRKRTDREKLIVLEDYLKSRPITDPVLYTTILQELEFDNGLLDGCILIANYGKEYSDLIRKCLKLLVFGSDKIAFLKATNLDKAQYASVLN
jgi:hypothetical protein